ncbi:MAG TPA: 4Fe-4S binding protein [Spirochaetota bacterium]|nr:4Fe-4S binding protein [Spirochaetota bacterium]
MSDIYSALQKRLDMYSLGFPETQSKIEITILKKLFSEDDAKLFMELSPMLEPAESIAARMGKPVQEIQNHLEDMVKRGLLFKKTKDGVAKYGAIPFIHGIFEFQVKRLPKDLAELLEQYYDDGLAKAIATNANMFLHPIPVNESIESKSTVAPFEDAVAIIQQANGIAVADCICRKEKKTLGKGCDKPMETCLMFGSMAEYYIENNLGRKICADEAIAIVKNAQKQGMVTQPGTAQNPAGMCSCCGDCCAVLLSIKRFPKPAEMVFSNYFAEVNDNCTSCGSCADICQMDAIEMNDFAYVNKDRCIGCGLCVSECPADAIHLVLKDNKRIPPKTSGEQMMQMAKQRGILPDG